MESLKAVSRGASGSHKTRQLRAKGFTPGIMYGHGLPPVSFAASTHDLNLTLRRGERLVEVELDGQKDNYLVKEVQYDAFGHAVIHVDLARVSLDETVKVTVAVVLRGTPAGATDGGVLVPGVAQVEVECLVVRIPDEIRVRVNDMKVGDVLRVRDLPAMEGVKILADGDVMVASCQFVAEVVAPAAVEGEEAVQPEVIGKGKKEEEEGEAPAAEKKE